MEIFPVYLACVASVPVRLSVRSRHFSLFGRAKIGANAKKVPFFRPRPNFRAAKKRKMPLEWAEKANGNACYAGYTIKAFFTDILMDRQMRSLINQNLNWRQCKLPFIVSLPSSVEASENKMGEKKWNKKTGNLTNNVLTKSQFGITKRRFEINAVYIYSSLISPSMAFSAVSGCIAQRWWKLFHVRRYIPTWRTTTSRKLLSYRRQRWAVNENSFRFLSLLVTD